MHEVDYLVDPSEPPLPVQALEATFIGAYWSLPSREGRGLVLPPELRLQWERLGEWVNLHGPV